MHYKIDMGLSRKQTRSAPTAAVSRYFAGSICSRGSDVPRPESRTDPTPFMFYLIRRQTRIAMLYEPDLRSPSRLAPQSRPMTHKTQGTRSYCGLPLLLLLPILLFLVLSSCREPQPSDRSGRPPQQQTLSSGVKARGGVSRIKLKSVIDLTPEELDVANAMCQSVLQDYLGDQIVAWYKTTYHYLPTSDDESAFDVNSMMPLAKPVTIISAMSPGPVLYFHPNLKTALKDELASLEASYDGWSLRIAKSLVLIDSGGGGGALGGSYDKITIIPYEVAIF